MSERNVIPASVKARMHEGVRGTVNQTDYERKVILNEPGIFMESRVGRLDDEAWGAGYLVRIETGAIGDNLGVSGEKFPGEGRGWFESRDDALVYVLHWLRCVLPFEVEDGAPYRKVIDRMIIETTSKGLFE